MGLFSKKPDIFLIVGLGNPGGQYSGTRHNAGFMAADFIAHKQNARFKKKFQSEWAEVKFGNKKCYLQKPHTFMNNSGLAVRDACNFYRIPVKNVIVMHDDITLEPGRFKLKTGGSDGGHNGLTSIITNIGDWDFQHIKIGIGAKTIKEMPLYDYVLQTLSDADKKAIEGLFDDVYGCIEMIVAGDPEKAKAEYNHRFDNDKEGK
ncbi:MAG TPA: aminoacyl-tRNA hydrolase [Oscillospiraceae bacterium]|nr:aminoacyl-tRNA hydrolase [Oscillospiraceae bacterium]HPK35782.1 aminoacyl-tRNA hydrolase [Oscillospiraceae bacterium]HPR75402.1 aminoacyl-tRNA hydrolase [Oscillospiraceae bacterium]